MYLAMHNWMRVEPVEQALRRMAKHGIEAIEISGEPDRHDTAAIRALLAELGMRCFGAVTLMMPGRNLLAADASVRATTVDYMKDCITMVSELDGEEMSIVPGTVGKIMPDAPPEQEWAWAVEGLREIYDHAQHRGVRMAIEPINRFETYFINRGAQAIALAEAVGPDCGVCLDVFHMNIEETDIYAAIHAAKDRLCDFHAADNNRMAPGMGTLDWPKIVQTLDAVGYQGPLSLEFCPPIDRTPANPFPDAVDPDPRGLPEDLRRYVEEHGSSVLTEAFYERQVATAAETLLPLIR